MSSPERNKNSFKIITTLLKVFGAPITPTKCTLETYCLNQEVLALLATSYTLSSK